MAQYITSPEYSYEPLPMEQYAELAKAQGQMYDAAQNQAYAFLQNLPILDGGLSTEGWAKDLRQKYGDKVQESIDKFVKTKDRRGLSQDLMSISRELKDDEDVRINNYDASESAKLLEFMKKPENRNMVAGFTMDNSGNMYYTDPNTGEQISNFRQFNRGESTLQDAERNYSSYTTGINIGQDAAYVKQFAVNSASETERELAEKNITQQQGEDGKTYFISSTTNKQFSNLNEAIADELGRIQGYTLSQQAVDAMKVQYDTQADETVRSYRIMYGDEEGFKKYVEDVYNYFYPTSQSFTQSETLDDIGTSAGGRGNTTTQEAEVKIFSSMTYNNMEPFVGEYKDNPAVNISFAKDVGNKINNLINTGKIKDISDLRDSPAYADLYQDYQKVVEETLAADVINMYDASELGQSLKYQQEDTLEKWYQDQDGTQSRSMQELDVTPEEIRAFQNRLAPSIDTLFGQENIGIAGTGATEYRNGATINYLLAKSIQSGQFLVPTPEMMAEIEKYNNLDSWWQQVVADEPVIEYSNMMQNVDGAVYMSTDDLVANGVLSEDSGLFKYIKSNYNNFDFQAEQVAETFNNTQDYFDALSDTEYYKQRADLLSENTSIGTPEYTIRPSAAMTSTMETYGKNLRKQLQGPQDVVSQAFNIFSLDTPGGDDKRSLGERKYSTKINSNDDLFKAFSDKVGEGSVDINYAGIPGNDLIPPGMYITVRDGDGKNAENFLIIPKGKTEGADLFEWINDPKATITQKDVNTRVAGGPLMGLPGDSQTGENSVASMIEKGRRYSGIISGSAHVGNFATSMANNGIEITNQFIPKNSKIIMSVDTTDPNMSIQGSGENMQMQTSVYYPMINQNTLAPITWQNYFEGNSIDDSVSLREAVSVIRSQVLSEDLSPEKGEKLIYQLYNDSKETGNPITGKSLMEGFETTFGKGIDFTRGIVFNNYIDAIDFYRLEPQEGRTLNREETEEDDESNPPRGNEEVTQQQPVIETPSINQEPTGPEVIDSSGIPVSDVPLIQSDSLITQTDSLSNEVSIPPNASADSLTIPEPVVEQLADTLLTEDNLSEADQVVADLVVNTPELITNPLTAAADYLGVKETDPAQYNTIASFYQSAITDTTLLASTNENLAKKVAWCAAFTNYILNDVGIETKQLSGEENEKPYARVRAKTFEDFGTPIYKVSDEKLGRNTNFNNAMPGDIVVKKEGGQSHVGFYVGVDPNDPGKILILGGNQDDEVNVTSYPATSIQAINRIENISNIDPKLLEKISKDIKESGSTV